MGGASKILMLLSTPSPLLYPRPPGALRLVRRSRTAISSISSDSNFNHNLPPSSLHPKLPFTSQPQPQSQPQSQSTERQVSNGGDLSSSSPHYKSPLPFSSSRHPWSEWTKLLDNLTAGGYYPPTTNSISTRTEHCDDDSFAVYDGLQEDFVRGVEACLAFARYRPDALRFFTKKNIEVVVNDGSPFLFKNGANSAKRMKLFLSSDENNVMESERAQTLDLMRYLLSYAYNPLTSSGGISHKNTQLVEASVRILFTEFVNFSEHIQTRPTESTRRLAPVSHEQHSKLPGRNIEMKRGDWICEKCNFMNFARNTRCFKCEDSRPRRQLTGREWECPQCDFFNYGRNISCLRCDCKRPEQTLSAPLNQATTVDQILTKRDSDMPEVERKLAANEGRVERILASSQTGVSTRTGSGKPDETSINRSLDRIFGRTLSQPADAEANNGAEYTLRQSIARSDPNYVPFVPLPPDMFSKSQDSTNVVPGTKDGPSPLRIAGPIESLGKSSVNSAGGESNDGSSDAASERLSQKGVEVDGFMALASEVRDDADFPEIMPIRKGENRFVVSKKKDRSLTSPQYKRRLAMEQANKTDFVPFVPFPPDYFAKKDEKSGAPPASNKEGGGMERLENNVDSSSLGNESRQPESKADHNKHDIKSYSQSDDLHYSRLSNSSERGTDNVKRSWDDGVAQVGNKYNTNSGSSSTYSQTARQGFSGKSLEGSAVTEPDPLDMSEEAKAARWFRRAAQIKDISELNAIPDEDFPEIMPMRKGVNRFVVSKRKTPLERRLTSPQYRKNLPIVSSEPEKEG